MHGRTSTGSLLRRSLMLIVLRGLLGLRPRTSPFTAVHKAEIGLHLRKRASPFSRRGGIPFQLIHRRSPRVAIGSTEYQAQAGREVIDVPGSSKGFAADH